MYLQGTPYKEGVWGNLNEKLTIPSATRVNEGQYKCVASNKLMKDAMTSFRLAIKCEYINFIPKLVFQHSESSFLLEDRENNMSSSEDVLVIL